MITSMVFTRNKFLNFKIVSVVSVYFLTAHTSIANSYLFFVKAHREYSTNPSPETLKALEQAALRAQIYDVAFILSFVALPVLAVWLFRKLKIFARSGTEQEEI